MKSIIVTSIMRTGSTWLKDLLMISTNYPYHFLDPKQLYHNPNRTRNTVYKAHMSLNKIYTLWPEKDYRVVAIVRNPRDRYVSRCLRNIGRPLDWNKPKNLKYFVDGYRKQLHYMKEGRSTRDFDGQNWDYVWTTYEWMVEDTEKELSIILNFAKFPVTKNKIRNTVAQFARSYNSGLRHQNFRELIMERTEELQNEYLERIGLNV